MATRRRVLSVLVISLTTPVRLFGVEFSDDFGDGIVDSSLWVYGGEDRSHPSARPGPDTWSVSEAGGYLATNVRGPVTGITTGESVWVRTAHDYNDGLSHMINFTWKPEFLDDQWANLYYLQVTDGRTFPNEGYNHWTVSPPPGTSNLLWTRPEERINTDTEFRGWLYDSHDAGLPAPDISNWSVTIAPPANGSESGTARLYMGPNGTGEIRREEPLDASYPWHMRFLTVDATSSGGGPVDAGVNLYDYSSATVPEPSTLVLLTLGVTGLLCHSLRRRRQRAF